MSQRERPHVSRALGLPRVQGGQSAEQSTGGGCGGGARSEVGIAVAAVLSGGPAGRPCGPGWAEETASRRRLRAPLSRQGR